VSDEIPFRTPAYRVSRSRGMDPATRRLVFIAAGLGGALLVMIGAWSLMGHGGGETVPVIAPPAGPLRVKPANPGGMQVPGAGQPIFSQPAGGTEAQSSLMPAPERPDPQALLARGTPPASRPATPAGSPPAPAETAGLPLPPSVPPAPAAGTAPSVPPPAPYPAATTASPAATAAGTGGPAVQLAALPTRAAAEAEWHALRRRLPDLRTHRLNLSQATVAGHLWWRVRTAGFASPAAAHRFCAHARAAGVACDVTPF
jgi:SPOR domain